MKLQKTLTKPRLLNGLFLAIILSGCATSGEDPWRGWNRNLQSFNDSIDKNILKPVATGYEWVTPKVVDESITNIFSNINDIGVGVNDLLQFKVVQGGMDMGRFLVNTTLGIGGILDVGSMMNLPKHHEDFGQTLGVWGVPSGPYLVLPFYGPSSPRDTVGIIGDAAFNPLTYVSIFGNTAANIGTAGAKALEVTDTRAQLLTTEKIVNEASTSGGDRYEFIKNAYKQRRQYLITDGKSENSDLDIDSDYDADDKSSKPDQKAP